LQAAILRTGKRWFVSERDLASSRFLMSKNRQMKLRLTPATHNLYITSQRSPSHTMKCIQYCENYDPTQTASIGNAQCLAAEQRHSGLLSRQPMAISRTMGDNSTQGAVLCTMCYDFCSHPNSPTEVQISIKYLEEAAQWDCEFCDMLLRTANHFQLAQEKTQPQPRRSGNETIEHDIQEEKWTLLNLRTLFGDRVGDDRRMILTLSSTLGRESKGVEFYTIKGQHCVWTLRILFEN
jgi:hypothetical protein